MLSGKGNEKGEKTTIGLISEKATLHVQHPFFVHFFAVVFHDYNVKFPETSWLCVLWRKCRTCSCSLLFSLSLIYTRWPQHFSFSHHRYKISRCLSQKKCLLCFFYLALAFFSLGIAGLSPLYFLFFSVFLFLYFPKLCT